MAYYACPLTGTTRAALAWVHSALPLRPISTAAIKAIKRDRRSRDLSWRPLSLSKWPAGSRWRPFLLRKSWACQIFMPTRNTSNIKRCSDIFSFFWDARVLLAQHASNDVPYCLLNSRGSFQWTNAELYTASARACLHRKRINISTVLAGQKLGSKESMKAFGSSASSTMILDTSTWSRKPCNPSTTRSARGCHPCLRYDLLPMSPGWTRFSLVSAEGLEPSTP
jgi:hypothetical protein